MNITTFLRIPIKEHLRTAASNYTAQGQVESSHWCSVTKTVFCSISQEKQNFAVITGKYLCWGLFLIKNFKGALLKRDSSTGVFL